LTWDRGKKLSDEARFTIESGVKAYFADPRSPLAALHGREHKRAAAPTFPQMYLPVSLVQARGSNRSTDLEKKGTQDVGLKNPADALNSYQIRLTDPVLLGQVESASTALVRVRHQLAVFAAKPMDYQQSIAHQLEPAWWRS
jgi:hypothetical protein